MSLPAGIQSLLADGRLSAGHAKALLGTPDRAYQEQLARRAAAENWSVRMLEEAVRDRDGGGAGTDASDTAGSESASGAGSGSGSGSSPTRLRPPGLLELEQLLAEHLSTRVSVTMGSKRGKVVIDFADLGDLERIYHQMTTQSGEST
jgi:ParB family chromosome partitioning protein